MWYGKRLSIGVFEKEDVKNADETHFVVSVDNK